MQRFNATLAIFVLVLALTGFGLVMIYSSSAVVAAARVNKAQSEQLRLGEVLRPVNYHWLYLQRQLVWCGFGMLALILLYGLDYNVVLKRSKWLLILTAILLAAVYIPHIGQKINGARRWIRVGPMTFQPSELAKLAVIIATAKMLNDGREQLLSFNGFLPPLLLSVGFVAFIGIEDLGAAIVLALITATLWFIAGVRFRHLMLLGPIGMAGVAVGVVMRPFRLIRILIWLLSLICGGDITNPAVVEQAGPIRQAIIAFGMYIVSLIGGSSANLAAIGEKAWHIKMALIAVGTGGWTGLGAGMGIQKHYFLPAVFTDFVMADICEELGFIGAIVLLILFALLCAIGFRMAYKSPDFVGALLAAGMTAMIAVPALINVAVVLACVPTKGLALPFISYGGSSLLINLSAMGLLMNIARRNEQIQEVRQRFLVSRERRVWKLRRSEGAG